MTSADPSHPASLPHCLHSNLFPLPGAPSHTNTASPSLRSASADGGQRAQAAGTANEGGSLGCSRQHGLGVRGRSASPARTLDDTHSQQGATGKRDTGGASLFTFSFPPVVTSFFVCLFLGLVSVFFSHLLVLGVGSRLDRMHDTTQRRETHHQHPGAHGH